MCRRQPTFTAFHRDGAELSEVIPLLFVLRGWQRDHLPRNCPLRAEGRGAAAHSSFAGSHFLSGSDACFPKTTPGSGGAWKTALGHQLTRSRTKLHAASRAERKGTGEVNPPMLETPLIPHQKPLSQGPVPLVPPVSSRRVFPGSSRKSCGRVCLGRTCLVLNKHRWGCWGGEGGSGEARSPGLAGRVLFHTLTWPATRANFPSINFLFITYLSFKS